MKMIHQLIQVYMALHPDLMSTAQHHGTIYVESRNYERTTGEFCFEYWLLLYYTNVCTALNVSFHPLEDTSLNQSCLGTLMM